jgi:hypothetical protein
LHIDVKPSNVAIHAFPLTGIGASLMFTTQLTGCCIVMIPGGGTWSVAHLQPTGETGEALPGLWRRGLHRSWPCRPGWRARGWSLALLQPDAGCVL